jgi:hypothetical protein
MLQVRQRTEEQRAGVSYHGVRREVGGVLGGARWRRLWAWRWQLIGLGFLMMSLHSGSASIQTARPAVYVVPIEGIIDLGLARSVQRVLAAIYQF